MPNPGQQTALNEFLEWELQSRVEIVADKGTGEKVYFMPLQNVKSYFTANDGRKLNKILTEVFKSKYPPIDADLVLREHTAVFCILLHMGQGKLIEHFACYEELSDRRLPFDSIHPPREFPALDEDPNILRHFCEEQTAYCVPVFDSHMVHKRFGGQRLLPIRSRRSYGPPGVANQYVVTIYGPHNKLLPAGSDTVRQLPVYFFPSANSSSKILTATPSFSKRTPRTLRRSTSRKLTASELYGTQKVSSDFMEVSSMEMSLTSYLNIPTKAPLRSTLNENLRQVVDLTSSNFGRVCSF
jgi:hypothetical protein